jgi:hypothetical protein
MNIKIAEHLYFSKPVTEKQRNHTQGYRKNVKKMNFRSKNRKPRKIIVLKFVG